MGITPFAGGTDWFKSAEVDPSQQWNNTVEPELTAAQSAYTTALSNKTSYEATYTAAQNAMIAAMNGPLGTPAERAALKAAIDDFEAKASEYHTRINTLQTAANTLIEKQFAAYELIEDLGGPYLTQLLTLLNGEIDQELTLQGINSNTLLTELSDADTARTAARTSYLNALSTLKTRQSDLTGARALLADYLDDQLTAQAKINFNNAGGTPAYTNPTAEYNTATGGVTTQTNLINGTPPDGTPPGLLTLRDHAMSSSSSSLTTYIAAIDDETAVLTDAQVTHTQVATAFLAALTAASQSATSIIDSARDAGIAHDTDLFAAHTSGFPADNAAVQALITGTLGNVTTASNILQADLANPIDISRFIDIPALPPAGTMSINDLMRFINAIERVISQLVESLRNADKNINTVRMKIWDNQGRFELTKQAAQLAWLQQVEAADTAYNLQVAIDNHNLSQSIYDKINFIKGQETEINAVIDQLNSEIAAQNGHGIDVINALNNANYIAVDVINYGQQVPPDVVNQSDVTDSDAAESSSTARTDIPLFPYPTTIPDYPAFDASLYEIPNNIHIPIPAPVDDAPPAASELPTNAEVDQLNAIVEAINQALYPIKDRLVQAGIEQLDGLPYDAVDKLFVRQYVPVRTTPETFDLTISSLASFLYGILAQLSEKERTYQASLEKGKAPPFFQKALDEARQPVTEAQHETAGATGAGVGIISANFVGPQARVLAAVGTVLESTEFLDTISSLLEQGSLIGGLQTATLLPTLFANYSQMGLVRHDLGVEIGAQAEARVQAAGAASLTDSDKLAAKNSAVELIGIASNGALLRERALDILKKAGAKDLNEEEIKALIGLLLLLLQLFLLLVATLLLAAAGGEDSLAAILAQVLPPEAETTETLQQLKEAGVEGIPETVPTTVPELVDLLARILEANLPATELQLFKADVTAIFAARGVELTFQNNLDVASQIVSQLFALPPEVQTEIRNDILASEQSRVQILRDDRARDTIRQDLIRNIRTIPLPVREAITTRLSTLPPLPEAPVFTPVAEPTITQATPIPIRATIPLRTVEPPRVTEPIRVVERAPIRERRVEPAQVTETPQPQAPIQERRVDTRVPIQERRVDTRTADTRVPIPDRQIETTPTAQREPPREVERPRESVRTTATAGIPLRISDEDRNALVLGLVGGVLTSENARNIIERILLVIAYETNPQIAKLFQKEIDSQENVRSTASAPGVTQATARVPEAAGIPGKIAAPQALPKDPAALLRDAFLNLSLQIDDKRLLNLAIELFDKATEGQTNFYQKSLDLILDPARSMIRNFSIYTRDGSQASQQSPLQIPLSG